MRKLKDKIRKVATALLSVTLICTAVLCVTIRIAQSGISPSLDLVAATMTLPTDGRAYSEPPQESSVVSASSVPEKPEESSSVPVQTSTAEPSKAESKVTAKDFEASAATDEEIRQYEKENRNKKKFPVKEFTVTQGNQSYQNVQIKNASSANIDIKSELNSKLGFTVDNTDKPLVLIYHTHTSESFLPYDTGYFYEGYYPRSDNQKENVCAIGDEIVKKLKSEGINAIHDTTIHDFQYTGSYERSYETVQSYLKKYPSIKIVLDIHRDGIGTDTEKSKPVFEVNGKKAAQIMILSGYNSDGCEEFKNWESNLRFALQLQDTASKTYKNMARPLYFADFMYNMHINTGSLLIEVGAESNTIEEVRYSGYLIGDVVAKVIKKNINKNGQQ